MARVLVVDDDRAIRELLRFALEGEGYEVAVFRDGLEILTYLPVAADPGVILMDVMMPHMDGWEVCRRLTVEPALLGQHALVLMTASLLPGESAPAPACAVLRKPFDLDQVYGLVATLSYAQVAQQGMAGTLSEQMLLAS